MVSRVMVSRKMEKGDAIRILREFKENFKDFKRILF